MNRRTFITWTALLLGGLAVLAAAPLALWSRIPAHASWVDRRLTRALRALVGSGDVQIPDLTGGTWTRARAAEHLVAGRSHLELLPLLSRPATLRSHLDELQERDFRGHQIEVRNGWVISETEIAIAVLLDD